MDSPDPHIPRPDLAPPRPADVPRPPDLYQSIPVPEPTKRAPDFWLVLLLSLLGFGVVGTAVWLGFDRNKDRKLYQAESKDDRDNQVKSAFLGKPADLASPEALSVDAFFKERGEAMSRKDVDWQLRHYDFPAMMENAQAQADTPNAAKVVAVVKEKSGLIESALKKQFSDLLKISTYSRHRIQRIEFNKSRTLAQVFALETDADGIYSRNRYWLKRDEPTWKIYDEESLEMGFRNSTLISNMMASSSIPALNKAMLKFAKLLQATQTGEMEECWALIKSLKATPLPNILKGVVYYLEASFLNDEGKHAEALEITDQLRQLLPDSVCVEQLTASIHFAMKNYKEALAAAQKYMEFLGLDPESVVIASQALKNLGKSDEGFELLKRSLTEFPDEVTLLSVLPLVATTDQMKEPLRAALRHHTEPESLFDSLAENFGIEDQTEALVELTIAMRELNPKAESLEDYAIIVDDHLLLRRAVANFDEAKTDLVAQFKAAEGEENFTRLASSLRVPKEQQTFDALCALFLELSPGGKNTVDKAKADQKLHTFYDEMDAHDGEAAEFFDGKLKDEQERKIYVRELAEAACLEEDSFVLGELLEALKRVDATSPLLQEFQSKLEQMKKSEDEKAKSAGDEAKR